MAALTFVVSAVCLLGSKVTHVQGHGYLADPPSRSSMWRFGFDTPVNYGDNELFCGGFQHQTNLGGKCGVCGDPYDGDRENEAGGRYATGTIAQTYTQGQDIDVSVKITANHKGWFEFRLCPVADPLEKATAECLNRNLLEMADGSGTRYTLPSRESRTFTVPLSLPSGLTCSQCVLQWKYHTGNSWGTDPDGSSCVGCGAQEEFYGCADVAILASAH